MAMSLLLPLSSARVPSASLAFTTGTRSRRTSSSSSSSSAVNVTNASTLRSGLLHCSFISSSTTLSFQQSSFSGLSFGVNLQLFNKGTRRQKVQRFRFVVRAGKAALCLTKRNRSRKSLARTHGFRRRMRTTSGRAILKRRRAKGRKILCTKTNPRRVSNGSK